MREESKTYVEEWNSSVVVLLINATSVTVFGAIFFSCLYGMSGAIAFHTAAGVPDLLNSPVMDPFYNLSAERRIEYLLQAMRLQFWMFFLFFVRCVALLWRTLWAQIISGVGLMAVIVLIFVYHAWSSRVDDFSLLLFVPKWMWGTVIIATVVVAGLDITFWLTLWRRSFDRRD